MLLCWILTPQHLVATMALCCVKIQQTQAKPWLNSSNLCKSLLRLMKPTPQTCSTASHERNPETRPPTAATRATMRVYRLLDSHMRHRRFSTPRLDLSHTRYPDGLVVHRSTWPENMVVIRRCTRHHAPPGFLAAPPCAGEHCTLLPRADFAADVIWHHMMTSSLHVSSYTSTSMSALIHIIRHVS